jgi:hypothetical protein
MNVPDYQIDAGAQALRSRMQSGRLTDWDRLPNSTKRKWRLHAACVLTAAASAKQFQEATERVS